MGFKLDAMGRPKILVDIIGKSAFFCELGKKDVGKINQELMSYLASFCQICYSMVLPHFHTKY